MLNQCILVGNIININKEEDHTILGLRIERYRTSSQEVDYDVIPCVVPNDFMHEYVREGVLLGVKANLKVDNQGSISVNVQKMTFISKKEGKNE